MSTKNVNIASNFSLFAGRGIAAWLDAELLDVLTALSTAPDVVENTDTNANDKEDEMTDKEKESEIVYGSGGYVMENSIRNEKWEGVDALPKLTDWDTLDRKAKKVTVIENGEEVTENRVSIQRLIGWFKSEVEDGHKQATPIVLPVMVKEFSDIRGNKLITLSTKRWDIDAKDYVQDKFLGTWPKAGNIFSTVPGMVLVGEEQTYEEAGGFLVNGWLINGVLLGHAHDGSGVKGKVTQRAGKITGIEYGKKVGSTPNPLWERQYAEDAMGWVMDLTAPYDNGGDRYLLREMLTENLVRFTDQTCSSVEFDSKWGDESKEVVEITIKTWAEKLTQKLESVARSYGIHRKGMAELNNVVTDAIEFNLPIWDAAGDCAYKSIPAPWELVPQIENRWTGKANMSEERIRVIGAFARLYVSQLIKAGRLLAKIGQDEQGAIIGNMQRYAQVRIKLAQQEAWAAINSPDSQLQEQLKVASRKRARRELAKRAMIGVVE